jgi:hypothetical protein
MNFKKIIIEQGPDVDGQAPSEYVEFSNDTSLKDIKDQASLKNISDSFGIVPDFLVDEREGI